MLNNCLVNYLKNRSSNVFLTFRQNINFKCLKHSSLNSVLVLGTIRRLSVFTCWSTAQIQCYIQIFSVQVTQNRITFSIKKIFCTESLFSSARLIAMLQWFRQISNYKSNTELNSEFDVEVCRLWIFIKGSGDPGWEEQPEDI